MVLSLNRENKTTPLQNPILRSLTADPWRAGRYSLQRSLRGDRAYQLLRLSGGVS